MAALTWILVSSMIGTFTHAQPPGLSPPVICETSLAPVAPQKTMSPVRLENLLRWIGTTHPAMNEFLTTKLSADARLFTLLMATGFAVTPVPVDEKYPFATPAADLMAHLLGLSLDVADQSRLETIRLGRAIADRSTRVPWANRLLTNLVTLRRETRFSGEDVFASVLLVDGKKINVRHLPGESTMLFLRTHHDSTLVGLVETPVRAFAREFLVREMSHLIELISLRAHRAASLDQRSLPAVIERLEVAKRGWDRRVDDFVRGLQEAPVEPSPAPARVDVIAAKMAASSVGATPPPAAAGEDAPHRVATALNQIMLRSKSWDTPSSNWSEWARTRASTRAWIDAFVAHLGSRRTAAFALLADLEATRREVETLRGSSDDADPALAPVCATIDAVAAAVAIRADLERVQLKHIHVLELMLADHLRAKLIDPEVSLGPDFAGALDEIAGRDADRAGTSSPEIPPAHDD